MTAKEYLMQAWNIDQRINDKLDQVTRLREMATKVTSNLSDTPRASNYDKQKMESIITRLIETEETINSDIDSLVDLKIKIMRTIWSIDDTRCRMVLEFRYINFKSWSDIALSLNTGIRCVYRIHSRALKKIEKKIKTVS